MTNEEPIQLVQFYPQEATDTDWAQFNDFMTLIQCERLPDDPLLPAGYMRRSWLSIPPVIQRQAWLFRRPDGSVVGSAAADIVLMEENQHIAQAEIFVLPEFRRQGLGRRLLAEIARAAAADQRRLLLFMTLNTVPAGAAFLETIGAQRGLESTENQLAITDLPRHLLATWQAQAVERAGGYELEFFTGSYPEELLAPMAAIKQAMNQAPTDDLDVEDFNFTPEILRQIDESLAQQNIERWTLLAREKASGEIAGYTEIMFRPHKPTIGQQGDTAVLEAHRGRGLGRWLKADMLLRVLAEKPAVGHIRTNNANSNAPMLKINHELGFRPYIATTVWQAAVNDVQNYLENHSSLLPIHGS